MPRRRLGQLMMTTTSHWPAAAIAATGLLGSINARLRRGENFIITVGLAAVGGHWGCGAGLRRGISELLETLLWVLTLAITHHSAAMHGLPRPICRPIAVLDRCRDRGRGQLFVMEMILCRCFVLIIMFD